MAGPERTDAPPALTLELLQGALDGLTWPIVVKDDGGRFVFANAALCRFLGLTREELLATQLSRLLSAEAVTSFRKQEEQALSTGVPTQIEVQLCDAVGRMHLVSCTKTLFRVSGRRYLVGLLHDVSDRPDVAAERVRGREFLAQVLDTVADPIFVKDQSHRWIVLNRAFGEFMGKPREELLGRSDYEFFPREEAEVFWAKDELVLRTGEVNENEEYLTDARKQRHIILTKKTAFTDEAGRRVLVGVIRDITQRRRDEQTLRESEERFRTIFNQGPLGMAVLDLELRLRRVNEMLCRMLEREEVELVGRSLPDLTHPEDRSRADDTAEHLLSGAIPQRKTERRLLKRGGGVLWGSLTLSLITDVEGEPLHFLAMIEDVSDRKRAEEQVLEARDAALESAQAKSRFLANVSHEIRTPLNAVIGLTGLLLEGQLNPDQRECIELIRSSGDALLTLLNDILDFSKLESDRMELERRPFDLSQCLEESLDLVAPRATEKGLELTYLVGPEVPTRIVGDITRLRQVLVNLLSNAVKFTASGEVRLEVSSREVPDGTEVSFAVLDTGIGIPPDRLDRLFQSFSQVDASTTRQFGGTGLGLAISRRLVELMGGRMGVQSVVDRGSTFHFSFVTPGAEGPAPADPAQGGLAGGRLLIIDDTASVRSLLGSTARTWGMSVQATGSVEEALGWLRKEPIDVVLLDRDMPGVHAADVAREVRALRPQDGPALVLLTPMGRAASERLRGVFQGQLTKPVKLGQLRTVLAGLLAARPAAPDGDAPRVDAELSRRIPLRILVVDDNVVNQKVAARILERMGYRADMVGSGREAVAAVRRQPYDVVLLDLHMPEMDGLEAAGHIRAQVPLEERPHLIAVTADVLHGDRERCLAAGMDDFVGKPVRIEELQAALLRCARARGLAAVRADSGRARVPPRPGAPPDDDAPLDEAILLGLRFLCAEGSDRAAGELYALFLQDAGPMLRDLRAAVARQDAAAVVRLAHGLRGSCANLGARLMLRLSGALEDQARAGRLDGAEQQLDELTGALERTREAARARLGRWLDGGT